MNYDTCLNFCLDFWCMYGCTQWPPLVTMSETVASRTRLAQSSLTHTEPEPQQLDEQETAFRLCLVEAFTDQAIVDKLTRIVQGGQQRPGWLHFLVEVRGRYTPVSPGWPRHSDRSPADWGPATPWRQWCPGAKWLLAQLAYLWCKRHTGRHQWSSGVFGQWCVGARAPANGQGHQCEPPPAQETKRPRRQATFHHRKIREPCGQGSCYQGPQKLKGIW